MLIGVELPPNYGERYTTSFKKIFVDLASEYNLVLVNGSIKDMTERGLHAIRRDSSKSKWTSS